MGRDNMDGFYGTNPPRRSGCPCCGEAGYDNPRECSFCIDQEHEHNPGDLFVGDYVAANEYAATYYCGDDGPHGNSDRNRRSVKWGIVTDVHHYTGSKEPGI